MQEDYPQMKVIKLEQNYRSTARILKIANKVIENNPKLFTKKLWSQFGEGEIVKVVACQSEQHEADWVVSQIVKQKLVGGDKTQYADFAVLYRGNHQARIFEEALRSARVPYQLSGGQSFFDKAEIKDVFVLLAPACQSQRRSRLPTRRHHAQTWYRRRDSRQAQYLCARTRMQPI